MLKQALRELLALVLCALMLNPPSMVGASSVTVSRSVLGTIETHGSVRVGEVLMPTEGTLFSGDRVQTNSGNALIQYKQGVRILLASGSLANFAPARVQLEKGLMSIQTASANGVMFAVSTLRLEPATAKTAANITLQNAKATVAVTEGTLKVVDPAGVQLASLNAGDARLFEEVAATSPNPASPSAAAPPAAAPQGGGSSSNKWLIAAGIAAAGLGVGVAALVRADDANDSADKANAAAAQAQAAATQAQAAAAQAAAQVAAANAQITALNAQIAALRAQVAQNAAASAQVNALATQLAAQVAALATAQAQLTAINQQISQLLAEIAAAGGQATPAQLAQLQALLGQTTTLLGTIQQITNQVNAIQSALGNVHFNVSGARVSSAS